MGWVSGIVVFLLTWWLSLFLVLPWSLKRDEQGKPDDPKMHQKVMWTTVLAAFFWLCIYLLIHAEIVDLHQMAASMHREDHGV
ncbi:MAG: DUF1467 family protein [Alphaproteobacteria bacterium]|nr:DUF1467 family protein [Alphaproteobacteria bacterium]